MSISKAILDATFSAESLIAWTVLVLIGGFVFAILCGWAFYKFIPTRGDIHLIHKELSKKADKTVIESFMVSVDELAKDVKALTKVMHSYQDSISRLEEWKEFINLSGCPAGRQRNT